LGFLAYRNLSDYPLGISPLYEGFRKPFQFIISSGPD
jgi:hypothetical protein